MVQLALNRFKDFFRDTPEYNKFAKGIKPEQINKDMLQNIQSTLKVEVLARVLNLYTRFKKVINYAMEHDVIMKNPCIGCYY